MSLCIVHVGMYKTGTTAIQRSLYRYEDDRFVYADPAGHPNHSQAVFALLGARHSLAKLHSDEARESMRLRFHQSLTAAQGRTLIISGEGLVNLTKWQLWGLKSILGQHFEDIRIAAAIRPPAAYMASALQTRIKRMRDPHLGRFFRYRAYEASFRKFDEVFGRERVVLWKYDPANYPGGCAVRDFCNRFGIPLPEQRIVRVNESLSREALGLLFIYRRMGTHLGATSMTGPENERLAQSLARIGGIRFRLAPDAVKAVLNNYRSDIQWMETRLGESLAEDFDARAGDVRSEDDLLQLQPHAIEQLLALLGPMAPRANSGRTLEDVAELVHALRQQAPKSQVKRGLQQLARRLLNRIPVGSTST